MSKNKGTFSSGGAAAKRAVKKFSTREKVLLVISLLLVVALVLVIVLDTDNLASLFKKDSVQTVESVAYIEKQDFSTIGDVNMQVHFIDVGQGDAILVRFPDGKDMIVDAGSGVSEKTEIRNDYLDYLESVQLDSVDYLIATHAHSDHMNFLDNVLDAYEVKNVYYNDYTPPENKLYLSTFEEKVAAETGVNTVKFDEDGDTYELTGDGYSVKIYAPGYETFDDVNYMSPFIVLSYAGRNVLLTGDAEEDSEKWFLEELGESVVDIDVLKVGHHGSKKGTCTYFLDGIKPEFAIISAGDENTYDHPTPQTMNDLFDYGIVTYRTDRHGNIVLYVDSEGDFGFLPEKAVITENNSKGVNEHYLKAALVLTDN